MLASVTQTFMAPAGHKDAGRRPNPLRPARSFPRAEARVVQEPVTRSNRAVTIQNGTPAELAAAHLQNATLAEKDEESDTFDSSLPEEPPECLPMRTKSPYLSWSRER